MRQRIKISIILLIGFLWSSSTFALGIEEFDSGPGGWDSSPRKISRTSTPGWVTTERDGEVALTNSPSPTLYAYYWSLTRTYDLANTDQPVFDFKFEFTGGEDSATYESFEVQIGDENAKRNADFTTLYTADFPAGILEDALDLSAYESQKVKIRLVLKKPRNSLASAPGVYIYRAGIAFPELDISINDNPDVLSLAAFNVQVFGKSKMRKDEVVAHLVNILSRYDLILFQEIRDSTGSAFVNLMDALNGATGNQYTMTISDRLGRTSSKEQYAYIYKSAKLELNEAYEYDDGPDNGNDPFEREPYVAHFRSPVHDYDFTLVGIHTSPKHAFDEIDALLPVYEEVKETFDDEDIILLGDLNASCNYVRNSRIDTLALRQDNRFAWHIDDDADTTTSGTKCAYDRFITTGTVTERVDAGATQVFYFDQAYSLDNKLAKSVSDHYPIEMQIDLSAR